MTESKAKAEPEDTQPIETPKAPEKAPAAKKETAPKKPRAPKAEKEREYPIHVESENYAVTADKAASGADVVYIAPVGWVGPPPLVIPADRLDELRKLLGKL